MHDVQTFAAPARKAHEAMICQGRQCAMQPAYVCVAAHFLYSPVHRFPPLCTAFLPCSARDLTCIHDAHAQVIIQERPHTLETSRCLCLLVLPSLRHG